MYGQTYGQPYGQQPYGQQPYGQPGYVGPPPPMYQQPTIIQVQNDNDKGTPCRYCGTDTTHITRRKTGCVAIAWGCCLLWTTGFFCWLPCVMDGCKDVELVCVKCQNVKNVIAANCC